MVKPTADTRKPYSGPSRSLVIALDVGTTFSGVSYAILEPGEVPKIHGVTRFPGQEHVAGNSKIPSIMYYDSNGAFMVAGAEAESTSVVSQAEDEGWIKAELFKLRLRPKTMKLKMNGMRLAPLPRHKTAVDVLGDFLSYLFDCTRKFIIDTHANGPALWRAVENDMQFVLSHPNGWEGAQQTKMRRAAVYGGLIPDTDEGKARIRFVTEGEASLHACVLNGLAADVLSNGLKTGFLVADAGGGTLDISSYAIRETMPLVIEEIAPPDCIFAGSVFVSRRARAFLEEKLKNSKYGTPDALDHITKRFDETTKRLFRDKKELQFVHFGSPLDKDLSVGIRGGQLKLTGAEVAELFEPSVEAAVASIKAQIDASNGVVKSVWLVGGFAASPWLFSQLQERLAPFNVTVSRPDTQTSKAVADGAIGFYSDHHVSARMSKFMYGVEYLREFDQDDVEHVERRDRLCELPSGPRLLPDAFDCILKRSVKVKESTVFTRKYCTELTSLSMLSVFEVEIWCYRGGGNNIPKWILRHAEEFSTLCVVRADLSPLSGSAQAKKGRNGKTYWTIIFSVEIHFGLTEFRARIKWQDNGVTKYGPASIVYNESGHRANEDEPDSAPEDDITVQSSHSDRNGSEPGSRARSRDPMTAYSSRAPSVAGFTNADAPAFLDVSDSDTLRNSDRRRSTAASSITSHTTASHSSAGLERSLSKGKAKDRSIGASPSSEDPGNSTSESTSGNLAKLSETLTSIWGSVTSPAPSAPPFWLSAPAELSPPAASDAAIPEAPSQSGSRSIKGISPCENTYRKAKTPAKTPEKPKTPAESKTPVGSKTPVAPQAPVQPDPPVAAEPSVSPAKTPSTKTPQSKTPVSKTPLSKTPQSKTPAKGPTPKSIIQDLSMTPGQPSVPALPNGEAGAENATNAISTPGEVEKKDAETPEAPAASDKATSDKAASDHTSPVVPETPPAPSTAGPAPEQPNEESTQGAAPETSGPPATPSSQPEDTEKKPTDGAVSKANGTPAAPDTAQLPANAEQPTDDAPKPSETESVKVLENGAGSTQEGAAATATSPPPDTQSSEPLVDLQGSAPVNGEPPAPVNGTAADLLGLNTEPFPPVADPWAPAAESWANSSETPVDDSVNNGSKGKGKVTTKINTQVLGTTEENKDEPPKTPAPQSAKSNKKKKKGKGKKGKGTAGDDGEDETEGVDAPTTPGAS